MKSKIKQGLSRLKSRKKSVKRKTSKSNNMHFEKYSTLDLLKLTFKTGKLTAISFWKRQRLASRLAAIILALIFIVSLVIQFYEPFRTDEQYSLGGRIQSLLSEPINLYAQKLVYNEEKETFVFNEGYRTGSDVAGNSYAPKITAAFASAPDHKVTVADPINDVSISLKPEFKVREPRKDINRIIYPIIGSNAKKVYTLKGTGVKEDIIFPEAPSEDEYTFNYTVDLSDGLEMRLEADGSLGVYGAPESLLGTITTATDEDAELLKKARENAEKTQLLFKIPAPYVVEQSSKNISEKVNANFALKDDRLTLHVAGLSKGTYPLSVDPTIYVESARKLMRGNNESNVDFDVDNDLIQKSQTTGARIDDWTSTTTLLPSPLYGQGTAVAGGYIYAAGGTTSNTYSYSTPGTYTFKVPTGVTSITTKLWGGGGGGGGGGSNSGGAGGDGGGAGNTETTLSVTAGEELTVIVGGGGTGGDPTVNGYSGDGGSGGGHSEITRSTTVLVIAPGGAGGGGGDNSSGTDGGDGGPGGCTSTATSCNGGSSGSAGGGGGATTSTAGSAGTGGLNNGGAGGSEAGGLGADGRNGQGTDGTGPAGGSNGGGNGGIGDVDNGVAGGGGGGSGRQGGGGGSASASGDAGGGGGGGGSGYATGTSPTYAIGSGTLPGDSSDTNRSGAGDGGTGGNGGGSATAGTDGDDGIVVIEHSGGGVSTSDAVYWAEFNSTTNIIESPTPSSTGVACSGWCNEAVYDLPVALSGLSLVAYNGYLYAIGGENSSGTPQTTVYIAKLGANGEPSLWHPTGGTPTYWYTDTALSNARSQFAAVAYNNKMYLFGGLTTSTTVLSTNTVQVADMKPNGTFTSWTTTGTQALSTARYGVTAHAYNDTLYVLGGNATHTGTPVSTVEYSKLDSDGTMNPWVTANSMITNGRMTGGGSFSTIFGGYMYINGGCGAVNASGYCTDILNTAGVDEVQLASINADGSIGDWHTIIGLNEDRFGHTMIAWQGGLYQLGGCRTLNTTSGECTNVVTDVDYGIINPDGEASTVATSVDNSTAPCSTLNESCDLPSSYVGNMLNASFIHNGYLYIMGGCTNNACTTMSNGITYQAIDSDGTLVRPDYCAGTYRDSYCDSTSNLPSVLGAPGLAVFNNTLYLVGGFTTSSVNTDIDYVTLNSDGSLGSWSNADLTTIGAEDVSYTYAYVRANASSASTVPGNLYIFGGCGGSITGIGCPSTSYTDSVYKCNLSTAGAPSGCTKTGQTQIGTVQGASGSGLGAHVGAVYANYIYLMGGLAPGITDLTTVYYAKFDDSNNVVESDGAGTSSWTLSPNEILIGRRRGAGFGYNGYLYVTGGYDGSEALADIEYSKIDVSDGSIGVWEASSVSINRRWGLTVPVSNSYAYVVGGCTLGAAPSNCNTRTDSIQTFQIYNNDSGAIVDFTALSDQTFSSDVNRWGASSAVLDGYIYVAGGCTSSTDCSTATVDVQYAAISATDGSIGTWASLDDLPAARAWGYLGVAGGDLYYVGGEDGTNVHDDVYYVTPVPGGGGSGGTIEHYSARRTSQQTKTTTGWSSVTGTADSGTTTSTNGWVDSSNLTAGEDYLVMVWAEHNGSNGAERSGVRVTHGGTSFTESQAIQEVDRTNAAYKTPYFWFTVWTAQSGEDLEVEYYGDNASYTSRVEDVTMLIMNAEALVSDGDLHYDIDTTGGTLDTTFTPKASVTWTPGTASDTWWTMGYVQGDTVDVGNDQLEFRLDIDSGTIRSTASIEGEDANDTPLYGIGWLEPFTAASHTVELEIRESAADAEWDSAGIFALNMDRFENFAEYSDPGDGTTFVAADNYVEQANIDPVITAAGAGDVIIAGGAIVDDDDRRIMNRLQLGGSNITDVTGGWQLNAADKQPITLADMQLNVSASTLNIDFDADITSGDSSVNLEDRWLVAFTMEQVSGAGTWNTATNILPDNRSRFGAAVWDDRIYVVGGLDNSSADSTTVYMSPKLASGGDISSAWTTTTGFNVARSGAAVTAYANNLYLFGGYDGSNYLNDVQYASIGYKTGTISQSGTTITGSGTTFTSAMVGHQLQYRDGEIATISSYTSATSIEVNLSKTVTAGSGYTILDGSVGEWTDSTRIPNAISDARAVSANGYIYLVGGRSASTTCTPVVQVTSVSANTTIATGNNGTGIGEWFETNVSYGGGRYGAAITYDEGKLYVMGGGCSSPINASYSTGTISQSGYTVTGSGTTWTDNYIGTTFTPSTGSAGTVIAVNSATSITLDVSQTITAGATYTLTADLHTRSTLKSQPQVAIYSRMIDTDTDVFPNSFLLNGLDNSIGARWQVRYRTMHDINPTLGGSDSVLTTPPSTYTLMQNPNEDCGTSSTMPVMTSWGRETNYGDVTLGDVSPYTALNSSGSDINCGRYFYFLVSIDASKTFGYPEDVNRGPTISDLSFFFTSDPSKRLRHGKSFTGGEQQPLDTPCRQSVDSDCPLP